MSEEIATPETPAVQPDLSQKTASAPQNLVSEALKAARENLSANTPEGYVPALGQAARSSEFDIKALSGSAADAVVESKTLLKAQGFSKMAANPITDAQETYQVLKLEQIHENFASTNSRRIRDLHDKMCVVASKLRALSNLTGDLGKVPERHRKIQELIDEQTKCGIDLMAPLQDTLNAALSAGSIEEQERVQRMIVELKQWQAEAVERIAQEKLLTDELHARVSGMAQLMATQSKRFGQAADMAVGAAGAVDPNHRLDYIQNARPENAAFVKCLREFLMESRSDMAQIVE